MYQLPLMRDYVDTVKIPIFDAYCDSTPCLERVGVTSAGTKRSLPIKDLVHCTSTNKSCLQIEARKSLFVVVVVVSTAGGNYSTKIFALHFTQSSRQHFTLRYPADSSSPADYCYTRINILFRCSYTRAITFLFNRIAWNFSYPTKYHVSSFSGHL